MPPDTLKYQKQGTRQLAPEREHATETTVAARVSHSTKAALKQLAEARDTDISKLVGRLVRQELARAGDEEQAHDSLTTASDMSKREQNTENEATTQAQRVVRQPQVGDMVQLLVYVCGEAVPTQTGRVVAYQGGVYEVDVMSHHGGAPWIKYCNQSEVRPVDA